MKKTKKTNDNAKAMPVVHRDNHNKSNKTLAKMIINGEIDEANWEYIVRKMGYQTRPVAILLEAYKKWK